jgi:hypothetical protein
MAQQLLNSRVLTFKAGEDLSTKIYYLVKLNTDGTIVLADADAPVIGVLQDKPKAGEPASVAIGETSKVILGGDVSIGDELVSDANGSAVARTEEHNVFGIALENGVAGDIIEVLLRPIYK